MKESGERLMTQFCMSEKRSALSLSSFRYGHSTRSALFSINSAVCKCLLLASAFSLAG